VPYSPYHIYTNQPGALCYLPAQPGLGSYTCSARTQTISLLSQEPVPYSLSGISPGFQHSADLQWPRPMDSWAQGDTDTYPSILDSFANAFLLLRCTSRHNALDRSVQRGLGPTLCRYPLFPLRGININLLHLLSLPVPSHLPFSVLPVPRRGASAQPFVGSDTSL